MRGNRYQYQPPGPSPASFFRKMQEQRQKQRRRQQQRLEEQRYNENLQRYQRNALNRQINQSKNIKAKKYPSNTNNVFYEDRVEAKVIRLYEVIRPLIIKIFILLFLGWSILYFVRPYQGHCPFNADCGVYISCHQGYIFDERRNDCVISKQAKDKASVIGESVIDKLRHQYGNFYCHKKGVLIQMPRKKIDDVFEEFEIQNKPVKQSIYQWFQDLSMQKKYKFKYFNDDITPTEPLFSLQCHFSSIINSQWFYLYFTAALVLVILLLIIMKIKWQNRRAARIFDYLKEKTIQEGEITIKINEIEAKFGKVYEYIWFKINQARQEDKSITYYEDQELHWKHV